MTTADTPVADAYRKAQREIVALLSWFEGVLECHAEDHEDEPTWNAVAELGIVRKRLLQTLAAFDKCSESHLETELNELNA
jgi:hypothetical protein